MNNFLVRIFGFPATLIHGDTLVLDRWLWLKNRLPIVNEEKKFLDVGCGSGAFTMGAAIRGYNSTGLSWDARNQNVAQSRAKILHLENIKFPICDVRRLDKEEKYLNYFDVAINFENIEHILDDRKLMIDIANCLKPGGMLLMTTPFYHYFSLSKGDMGPFSTTEDGGHVRRGYTRQMILELCEIAGLRVEEISFCSGYLSQMTSRLQRKLSILSPTLAWVLTLPFRPLILVIDKYIPYRNYSICLEAYKPRFINAKPHL